MRTRMAGMRWTRSYVRIPVRDGKSNFPSPREPLSWSLATRPTRSGLPSGFAPRRKSDCSHRAMAAANLKYPTRKSCGTLARGFHGPGTCSAHAPGSADTRDAAVARMTDLKCIASPSLSFCDLTRMHMELLRQFGQRSSCSWRTICVRHAGCRGRVADDVGQVILRHAPLQATSTDARAARRGFAGRRHAASLPVGSLDAVALLSILQ
jgi:hypothetical protein